ncbi:MAG: Monosaccharide-transporting ATPase [Parcubacteria group bacterium GW2011_GWA2_56_7]|nr:MAG: Monosaccharide-transporting ATPase [Parcubacteria group bacterium GW2011_GWA2_56_7]
MKISVQQLSKHFDGVHAVDGVSLTFESGTITGIVGPNGSGKTTLTHLLSGVLPVDGGAVVFDGVELTRVRPHEISFYGVTRTFQSVRLFEQMSVRDNLLVVLTERGVFASLFERHGERHLKRAQELLLRVGLSGKRDELAVNLSYGQRKLLEIARVLAMDPKAVLFDEPFAGLFPEMVKIVVSVIKELRDRGVTILLIEHNMELIRELSDHLVVMDAGRVLAQGEPDGVLARGDVIEAYLGG